MKKKILLIIAVIFLITGCSVDYKATVYSNYRVKETASFIGRNDILINYNENIDTYLDSQIDSYEKISLFKTYKFNKKINDDFSYVKSTKIYRNLKSYIKSPIIEQLFEDIDIKEENGTVTFTTIGETYYGQYFDDNQKHEPEFFIDEITIKLRFHNEIIEHNADHLNVAENTLEWNINSNNQEPKLYFKLGSSKKYDIILIDMIYDNKITIGIIGILLFIIYLTWRNIYLNHINNNSI